MKWKIDFSRVHGERQLSSYEVCKQTGIPHNTIDKYVQEGGYITSQLWSNPIATLCKFYGVEWHQVVEMISEENKRTLAPAG